VRNNAPTINDVALRASVSKTTVSHVINETRHVDAETRQRVLAAIAAIGYRPNKVARSLTTKRTGTIGMVVSDASNLFFGEMLRGVEEISRPANDALIVCNTDETLESEDHSLNLLLGQRVDGIIAAATSQKWAVLAKAEATHTPIVFVDRRFDGLVGPYVGADNVDGALRGTTHLIEHGYREIGVLAGFQRLSTMRERLLGFRQALAAHAIPLPEEWVVTSPLGIEPGRQAAYQILSQSPRPRALFVNNNLLSLGLLLQLKEMGLRCPEDVAIVGFDDHPWAAVSDPPLTVVRQPAREIGRQAAEMLYSLIAGRPLASETVEMHCELIVRRSACRSE
jgi:LacI family transcriptional regulator